MQRSDLRKKMRGTAPNPKTAQARPKAKKKTDTAAGKKTAPTKPDNDKRTKPLAAAPTVKREDTVEGDKKE